MRERPDPLREVSIVEQRDPALRRRWFESGFFDLFTWQDAAGAAVRFELYYDVERNERALVWTRSGGTYHDGVDHGGDSGAYPQAPILVAGGKFDSGTVVPRFERDSTALPPELRELILAKMREHLLSQYRLKIGRDRVRREEWQQRRRGAKAGPEN
jgi:hypothetical protein